MGGSLNGSGWILEIALMILLIATMFHAFRLERALGILRGDRAALEALVAGFNDSTKQAESGIERLRIAADGAGRQIVCQVDQARALKDDLELLIARGEKLAIQLEGLPRAAGSSSGFKIGPTASLAAYKASSSDTGEPLRDEQDPRIRSRAEKDLLRALRSVR